MNLVLIRLLMQIYINMYIISIFMLYGMDVFRTSIFISLGSLKLLYVKAKFYQGSGKGRDEKV